MTVQKSDVEATVTQVRELIAQEKELSPALKASLEVLLMLVSLLANRLGLNSKNSSKPPSTDPHRLKEPKGNGDRKPGGQHGHRGTTLKPVADPDDIKSIEIDRNTLPPGSYRDVGYEARQVIDLDLSTYTTEWRAQILEDSQGKRYVAPFPEGVTRPVQYGIGVKVNAVYMSQYQLIPYQRIEDHFWDQLQLPLSVGSIHNFIQDAYARLEDFDTWIRKRLTASALIHGDETGINVGGKIHWLHNASNDQFSYFYPHAKRGGEALNDMGVLPGFQGILCHDHWKPYSLYGGRHALCNAHHLRELQRAYEQDNQQWAQQMAVLLKEINAATLEAGGQLDALSSQVFRQRYRDLLQVAQQECPPPEKTDRKGVKGRVPRSKARNHLERLRDYENDVLRFMDEAVVPFTNNQAENDLRMTKVQQKISGCFRSLEGAKMFCRIRSYLSTCRKQGLTASEALRLLFAGQKPTFMANQPCAE